MQAEAEKAAAWKPYGRAPTEEILFTCVPGAFFKARWAVMKYNPLTWQVPGKTYTFGEITMILCIIGQFLWALIITIQNNASAVLLTGVAPPLASCDDCGGVPAPRHTCHSCMSRTQSLWRAMSSIPPCHFCAHHS